MDYSDSTGTPLGLVHQPTAAKLLVPVPVQSEWSPSGIPVLLGIPRTGQAEFTRTDGTRTPLGVHWESTGIPMGVLPICYY